MIREITGMRPRCEHEQQEAQLIHGAQHGRHGACGREEPVVRRGPDPLEERRSEQDPADDLADHGRLAEARKQVAARVRAHEQRDEGGEDVCGVSIGVRH
jgi:hypothetical protein